MIILSPDPARRTMAATWLRNSLIPTVFINAESVVEALIGEV